MGSQYLVGILVFSGLPAPDSTSADTVLKSMDAKLVDKKSFIRQLCVCHRSTTVMLVSIASIKALS